jgi:hypothetical protein
MVDRSAKPTAEQHSAHAGLGLGDRIQDARSRIGAAATLQHARRGY